MGNEAFKMRTISLRTGFSPAVLRAWERRYGLLAPERSEGGHRLYTQDDMRVLWQIKRYLDAGRAIGEVAALGREALLEEAARAAVAQPAAPGGALEALRAELVAAATELDQVRVRAGLDEAFARVSPRRAIEQVLRPALAELGRLWREGRCSVAGEHLLSAQVQGRLRGLLQAGSSGSLVSPLALCACLPDEQHELGALSVAHALLQHGYRVSYLGAALPLDDLEESARRLKPRVVCLSVSRATLLDAHAPRLVPLVRRLSSEMRLLLGGGGVMGDHAELLAAGALIANPDEDLDTTLRALRFP